MESGSKTSKKKKKKKKKKKQISKQLCLEYYTFSYKESDRNREKVLSLHIYEVWSNNQILNFFQKVFIYQ